MVLLHSTIAAILMTAGSLAVHTPANSTIISGIQFGSTTTFLKTTAQVFHMEKDLYIPGNLLYSDGTSLRSASKDGKTTSIVAGHPVTAGYLEGSSTKALFSAITGFLQIEPNLILVVDQGNHCVRLISRVNATTSPFTGTCKSPGYMDGPYGVMFKSPYSVIRDPNLPDRVFVTDTGNTALRSLDLVTRKVETILKTGSDGPYHAFIDKSLQTIYLTYGAYFGKVDLNTRIYQNITSKTKIGSHDDQFDRTSFAGARELLTFNKETFLVADRQSNLVRIVDLKQSWVRSICTRGVSPSSIIDGPVTNCSFSSPTSLLLEGTSLYIGELRSIRIMTVQSYEPECVSRTTYLTLKSYEKTAPVEVTPGVIMYYPIGSYSYEVPGRNCKVTIIVTPEKCPDPVYLVADSVTGTGAFSFEAAGHMNDIQLPIGTYRFRSKAERSDCILNVAVLSPTLKRRLDFKAVYNLSCKAVDNGEAINMIKAVASHRYDQIEDFCDGKCTKPHGDGVSISCENDKTTVTWITGLLYDANIFSVPKDFLNGAHSKMRQRGKYLDLAVNSHIPPVIYPIMNKDGVLASLTLTPVCIRGTYDKLSDKCTDGASLSSMLG